MKVTAQTTLAELALERAQLGITSLTVRLTQSLEARALLVSDDGMIQATRPTEFEALDAVFAKRREQLAGLISEEDVP